MTGPHNPEDEAAIPREALLTCLEAALERRAGLFDPEHATAFRLFNGFYEGAPELVVDVYAQTLVLLNYASSPGAQHDRLTAVQEMLLSHLPWVRAIVSKTRNAESDQERRGIVIGEGVPDRHIREGGVLYAIDPLMNQDASFYLDTRNLRLWVRENLADKTLLDAFAYTGSYGVAARAGGARQVVYLDLKRKFLNLARESYTLNGFPVEQDAFLVGDFWTAINRLKRRNDRFDCVIVDPPIFSKTTKGTIDMAQRGHKVINKVRPLINDQGSLVAINNGLFVSGAEYLHMLEGLCADGYLALERIIPIPDDFTGFLPIQGTTLPADPAPFNHPTKIAVLRVTRKAGNI